MTIRENFRNGEEYIEWGRGVYRTGIEAEDRIWEDTYIYSRGRFGLRPHPGNWWTLKLVVPQESVLPGGCGPMRRCVWRARLGGEEAS